MMIHPQLYGAVLNVYEEQYDGFSTNQKSYFTFIMFYIFHELPWVSDRFFNHFAEEVAYYTPDYLIERYFSDISRTIRNENDIGGEIKVLFNLETDEDIRNFLKDAIVFLKHLIRHR